MNANFNFRYLRNIESSFKLTRVIAFAVIVCCFGLSAWVGWLAYRSTNGIPPKDLRA